MSFANRLILYTASCAVSVCLAAAASATTWQTAQQGQDGRVVAIEGVKDAYGSCAVTDFFVHNLSRERVGIEVYMEDLKEGSWTAEWCQYNLLDPDGRLVKRFRPAAVEPGGKIRVRYDRCADYVVCMRPKFPKASSNTLQHALQRDDSQGGSVMQRIRVDGYLGSGASLKEAGRWWSQPFARIPSGKGSSSPE